VIVADLNRERLDFCKTVMGVDETLVSGEGFDVELRRVTDGNNPDVVIDATGSNVSMSNAFGYVAPTGRLVYVGLTTKEVTFKHPVFHRPEGTLMCSRNALPRDFTRIIGAIERGEIDTRPWITHRTNFENLIGDFPSFTKPETGVIKAVVEVS
jgi:threonine dehydrogenase-like Zn-dependent dehydrogenase